MGEQMAEWRWQRIGKMEERRMESIEKDVWQTYARTVFHYLGLCCAMLRHAC